MIEKIKIKQEVPSLNYIVYGGIILTIGLLLDSFKVFGNSNLIRDFFDILCPSMGFAIGIISIIRDDDSTNMFYRGVGIGFVFLGLINICKILGEVGYLSEEYSTILSIIEMISAYLIVIIPYIAIKFKYKLIGTTIFYFSSIFVVLVAYLLRYKDEYLYGREVLEFQNIIIILIFVVLAFRLSYKRKNYNDEIDKKYVYSYLVCTVLSHILYFLDSRLGLEIELYYDSIKYFSYFIIFQGSTKHLIKVAYFNIREDLEKTKEKREKVYTELSVRNRVLKDLNNSLIKSEKSSNRMLSKFKDGVILLYMEKVAYANDAAIKMLNAGKREFLLGLDFEQIVYLIAQNITEKYSGDYSEILDREYFLRNDKNSYVFKEVRHRDREYEITIVRADILNQIIHLKDVTDISQGIKHRKRYEELIKEREIKEEFYLNISHELRTPVNVIFSALQLKDIYIRDGSFDLIEKNDKVIKQNCLRLIRTINNFIDTNKISEGRMNIELNIYNIVEIIENIAQASTKYLDKVNTKLIFDAEEEEIYTKVDRGMIERVILNLLSNSIKHGKPNGLVSIYVGLKEKMVEISLRNNGYRIPEDAYPYIFDKFTKANISLSRDTEGSGLGLYLVRELIFLNSGELELAKSEGEGNEFKIRLPIIKELTTPIKIIESEMITLEEKVDIEFSDVYI